MILQAGSRSKGVRIKIGRCRSMGIAHVQPLHTLPEVAARLNASEGTDPRGQISLPVEFEGGRLRAGGPAGVGLVPAPRRATTEGMPRTKGDSPGSRGEYALAGGASKRRQGYRIGYLLVSILPAEC